MIEDLARLTYNIFSYEYIRGLEIYLPVMH